MLQLTRYTQLKTFQSKKLLLNLLADMMSLLQVENLVYFLGFFNRYIDLDLGVCKHYHLLCCGMSQLSLHSFSSVLIRENSPKKTCLGMALC